EKASDLGGVWRENTYPGAGCDVPSPLYSFSFAHNARWPRRYAGQAAIHAYLARTAREYGVIDHIRFDVEVTGAEFDDHRRTWLVHTDDASRWHARVFVPAPGQLSRPAYPRIPGTETFRGPSFHSAQWRHDVPLRGRRVAVIGTGASAVQFVPHVQADATRLTVFQRSPPYILPKRDHSYDRWPHRAFGRVSALQTLDRFGFWLYTEFAQQCLARWQWLAPVFRTQARRQLRKSVPDPTLREKLTPDYALGCKRVLFSNDYLPALTRRNVDVVTTPITEITANGVRTDDGVEHEVDVIIYGTGFASLDMLAPMKITGSAAQSLATT